MNPCLSVIMLWYAVSSSGDLASRCTNAQVLFSHIVWLLGKTGWFILQGNRAVYEPSISRFILVSVYVAKNSLSGLAWVADIGMDSADQKGSALYTHCVETWRILVVDCSVLFFVFSGPDSNNLILTSWLWSLAL